MTETTDKHGGTEQTEMAFRESASPKKKPLLTPLLRVTSPSVTTAASWCAVSWRCHSSWSRAADRRAASCIALDP